MRHTLALVFFTLVGASSTRAADWPGFRGPFGNGVSQESALPLKWGPTENVAWKVELPGPGASSPVVVGDRVFVTSFTGTKAEEIVRHVQCFDRKSGTLRWHKPFPAPLPENDYKAQITQHGLATSTPVTDGKRLYVYFGRGGVHAFDLDGQRLWHRELGQNISVFGSGASPILLDDKLIVNAERESSQLCALDKNSGKVLWKSSIHGYCWSTPVVVPAPTGKKEIVLNVGGAVYGYDAASGAELWYAEVIATYNGSTPLVRDGVVFVMNQGAGEKEFIAIRAGGKGDVTKTHVLWRQDKAGASYCSPLLIGDHLYYFSGQAHVLRAKDGQVVAKKALPGIQSMYGSPIVAGNKIVLFTRRDGAYVVSADPKLDVLAHNDLGDDSGFSASPALVNGQIFMRSNRWLYCLGRKSGE